jgi:hypothetical protein
MAEEEDRYTLEKKNAPNDQWKGGQESLVSSVLKFWESFRSCHKQGIVGQARCDL